MNKKDLPAMYSTAFWYLFLVLLFFFWLYCVTTVTPFIGRSEGWSLWSVGVLDQSQQECRFLPKFKSAANFSAPAQERNLFFVSGRSVRKKIDNFPIKSSHLCRASRHVWLSSSACDHCRAYQLICIMTISTYTMGARAQMTLQLGCCTVKKWILAPVV